MTSDFVQRPFGSFGRLGPGSRIAGYLIEEQIGAGGMAVVFRARDELLGRLAAVKVITPSMADNEDFRARFLRESRAAAAVDSPYILPVYGAGEAAGLLFIATRFVPGGDLAGLLRRAGGQMAPDLTTMLVSQVASALDAAHAAGLVHRDVKPQNILVDSVPGRAEHAYLSDFGLSKGMQSTGLTSSGQFLGTPDYSAPEQIRGGHVDGRADQYALACAAFALLAGRLPFHRQEAVATMFAHLQDPVPSLAGLRRDLPAAVDRVIARAMAKSPDERYGRCAEFAAALREVLVPTWGGTGSGGPRRPPRAAAPAVQLPAEHPSFAGPRSFAAQAPARSQPSTSGPSRRRGTLRSLGTGRPCPQHPREKRSTRPRSCAEATVRTAVPVHHRASTGPAAARP